MVIKKPVHRNRTFASCLASLLFAVTASQPPNNADSVQLKKRYTYILVFTLW